MAAEIERYLIEQLDDDETRIELMETLGDAPQSLQPMNNLSTKTTNPVYFVWRASPYTRANQKNRLRRTCG